jgi:PAS domain S-box-containing protein
MKDFASSLSAGSNSMPPPKSAPAASYYKANTEGVSSPNRPGRIAPQHSTDMPGLGLNESSFEQLSRGQKVLKRAANRKSAQLSRKRKKQCIEVLHEENNDLRRKNQILRAIPDLIVVFDSAGKLWFVSESVSMFLGMPANELEGTSFWDCLCEDSVRLVKAAFMDSLAAREPESDTVSLGAGVWELRLVDKDGRHNIVTLNGVVHFAGDRPECVCSIRPVGDKAADAQASSKDTNTVEEPKVFTVRNHVKPQQSVVSSGSHNSSTRKHKRQIVSSIKEREIARNSMDSSSSDSLSGSSDSMIPSP